MKSIQNQLGNCVWWKLELYIPSKLNNQLRNRLWGQILSQIWDQVELDR